MWGLFNWCLSLVWVAVLTVIHILYIYILINLFVYLFVVYAVSSCAYRASDGKMVVISNWNRYWRKWLWINVRYVTSVWMEVLRKTIKTRSQNSQSQEKVWIWLLLNMKQECHPHDCDALYVCISDSSIWSGVADWSFYFHKIYMIKNTVACDTVLVTVFVFVWLNNLNVWTCKCCDLC